MKLVVGAAVLGVVAWAAKPWVELGCRTRDHPEPPEDSWFEVELPEPRPMSPWRHFSSRDREARNVADPLS